MSEFTQMYGSLKARYAEREREIEHLLGMIGRISDALGISNEDQSVASGDEEILFAIEELKAATPAPVAQKVQEEAFHVPTLESVLRGLKSEDDSTQLRAIISEVEAMLAAAQAKESAVAVDRRLYDPRKSLEENRARLAAQEADRG